MASPSDSNEDPVFRFPFATAPEIIRANQKDSYVESTLNDKVVDFLQSFKYGSRLAHSRSSEISTVVHALYLGLTTLIGSRTLGEEYTDLFYTTSDGNIPTKFRRLALFLTSSFGTILTKRWSTHIYARVRLLFESQQGQGSSQFLVIVRWMLDNVSLDNFITLNLALFYLTGSYYQISKRLTSMRYSFGHKINPMQLQNGYEILGVLVFIRLTAKIYMFIKEVLIREIAEEKDEKFSDKDVVNSNNGGSATALSLADPTVLPFITPQYRVCTLCLEPMTSPTSTLCGHLFCWTCICEWCREKPECPLCRQACMEQNLLPIR